MRNIYSPPANLNHAFMPNACQMALEPAIWQLIGRAEAAGWPKAEALAAAMRVLEQFGTEQVGRDSMDRAQTLTA